MGAMPWQIVGPYDPDPATALRAVQAELFERKYNLEKLLDERIAGARESVRNAETDDDEYGLLEAYRGSLSQLEDIRRQPLPGEVHEQIALLRRVEAVGSGEIGNVLDIQGVANHRQHRKVLPLSSEELQNFFGTMQPTRDEVATERLLAIYNSIDRGEAVCFSIFDPPPSQQPIGWCFVGYTAD
jgi:hypothetical protein